MNLKEHHLPILTFCGSILVLSLFLAILPARFCKQENSDYIGFYEPVARNILAGKGLTLANGTRAIAYPPGYPLVLAAIFRLCAWLHLPENTVLFIFTSCCMSSASALIFIMSRRLWQPFPALISSLAWITYPFNLWLAKQPNSEILFMPIFYGSFCLLSYALSHDSNKPMPYFLCGLLAGIAMLIRPIALGIGIVMGTIVYAVKRETAVRIRSSLIAMLLLGNLAAVAPWQWWLYSRAGKMALLGTGGPWGVFDGLTFAVIKDYRQPVKVPKDVEILMHNFLPCIKELDSPIPIARTFLEQARIRPQTVVKLLAIKMARSWYGTDSGQYEDWILLIQIPYILLILWSSLTSYRLGGTAKRHALGIGLMILYFWMMTTVALSIVRYMAPVLGLSLILLPATLTRKAQTT